MKALAQYLIISALINRKVLTTMNIQYLIGGNIATLLVYGTPHSSYQYQILFKDGSLFQPHELYTFSSLALEVGLAKTRLVNSYQPLNDK